MFLLMFGLVLEVICPPGPRNVVMEEIRTAHLPPTLSHSGLTQSSAYFGNPLVWFIFNSWKLVEFLYVFIEKRVGAMAHAATPIVDSLLREQGKCPERE